MARDLFYLITTATFGEKVIASEKLSSNQEVVRSRNSVKRNLSWGFGKIRFIESPYFLR